MRYTRFDVKNFRGIIEASIPLAGHPASRIHTLVGLNESGKTTVLEAINSFNKTGSLAPLKLEGYVINDLHSLIPISKRSNFNGAVEITAHLEPSEEDEEQIKDELQREHDIWLSRPIGQFSITRKIAFVDSRHSEQKSGSYWHIALFGSSGKQRKPRPLVGGDDWPKIRQAIASRIPDILFFPNFLFEFPERIYLEPSDDQVSSFYRIVLQDILDSLENGTNVTTHILDRARSGNLADKTSLEGLLLEMSRQVSRTVFSAWDKMFHQQFAQKQVVFSCAADDQGRHYVSLRLEDSDGVYQIRERSLGFRWFFVFLLLTHYRGFRRGKTSDLFFMFDEPASNLHPTAQSQLLKSFGGLGQRCDIIYTTHSHYLINPSWLETAFVVRNEGLNYASDAVEYSARKTNITVTRYREFAAKHPDQSSYFQPILDVLDYAPSALENVPDVVMVEGKTDFYVLKYLAVALGGKGKIALLPGTGAGSLRTPIQLYLAWGRPFIVLLDSDTEGTRQTDRYVKEFGELIRPLLKRLGDYDAAFSGEACECAFTESERMELQVLAYPDDQEYAKKHFHRALQEHVASGTCLSLSAGTRERTTHLLSGLARDLREARQRTVGE